MKYEIFSCQTPTVRLDKIFSTGSRNKERMKIYIKQIITYTDISKPYNQSQNCFVIAFNNLGIWIMIILLYENISTSNI